MMKISFESATRALAPAVLLFCRYFVRLFMFERWQGDLTLNWFAPLIPSLFWSGLNEGTAVRYASFSLPQTQKIPPHYIAVLNTKFSRPHPFTHPYSADEIKWFMKLRPWLVFFYFSFCIPLVVDCWNWIFSYFYIWRIDGWLLQAWMRYFNATSRRLNKNSFNLIEFLKFLIWIKKGNDVELKKVIGAYKSASLWLVLLNNYVL